jgi:hypothetical protein
LVTGDEGLGASATCGKVLLQLASINNIKVRSSVLDTNRGRVEVIGERSAKVKFIHFRITSPHQLRPWWAVAARAHRHAPSSGRSATGQGLGAIADIIELLATTGV